MFENVGRWVADNVEAVLAVLTVAIIPFARWARKRMVRMFTSDRKRVDDLIAGFDKLVGTVELMRSEQVSFKTRLESYSSRQWALLASSAVPTFETDALGENLRVNRAYVELVERSADEVAGRHWEATVHPDDLERVLESWRGAIAGRRNFECDFRIVARGSRKIHFVRCTAIPLLSDETLLTGYLGTYEFPKQHH